MSDIGSVFQKGGGGTGFEQFVQTAFLTTLIIGGGAPGLPTNEIIEIGFQNTNKGYETDDLLIVTKSSLGLHRLLIQIKHDISFTSGNATFQEVISAFWKDYKNTSVFDKTRDKLIVVKNGLTKDERNHLKALFNWSNTHATEVDFITEVDRIKGKKDRLNVFRECLKIANEGVALSDLELWEFLKCVDVLEYDFLNQSSIDKAYLLNLIKLSKRKDALPNEEEIWNSILAYVMILDKDGGNVTLESIQTKEFYSYFSLESLSPYFKAVEKLVSDSTVILRPFKNTIGKLHLLRTETIDLIIESIISKQWTIITGKPGVGKSAIVKTLLNDNYSTAAAFVFRADQFNQAHLANVLSNQGVNETLENIFSCISLIPDKFLFIDSLEKLLEADPECAFKQLQALIELHPDIHVIATSRKYAVDLVIKRFGIDKKQIGIIEIPPLSDKEFEIVSDHFPEVPQVLKNQKIKSLLRSPKYLDFAIKALEKSEDNYSTISLLEFKAKLWDALVVDATSKKDGMPIKREKAFMEVAVKRAKEMKLFTEITAADPEAITLLEGDEILFQEPQKRRYAPSHDILEDWALIRYVQEIYENHSTAEDFFSNLGNEPAIRRAFRLWVEDLISDDGTKIHELIKETLLNDQIERYWADELLIAVFKSEESQSLFNSFATELLLNNKRLLIRFIHVLKTCCKETNPLDSSNLLPIGSGWQEALIFLDGHYSELEEMRINIINLLLDWQQKLVYHYTLISQSELIAGKSITLKLISEIESGVDFWQEDYGKENSVKLIPLLYDLAPAATDEIKHLIEKAYSEKDKASNWQLHSFYKGVIKECLSGIRNQNLVKELPELIVEIAWKEWKLPPKVAAPSGTLGFLINDDRLDGEECWGIKDKSSFFPSGIYKVPLYYLLSYNRQIGLEFITEFLNYSVDFYANAKCQYKHNLKTIDVELNDGTIIKQWGGSELWSAYRGLSVTHYAIESLLMSLEKFMLDLAEQETEESKIELKEMFGFLLKNSNNVLITSVLLSVSLAYPDQVEEAMLPLFKVKEFYEWDLSRSISETRTLSPLDEKIPFAQDERWRSNQLVHRRKYYGGLRGFVLSCQLSMRQMNPEIFSILDQLKSKAEPDDWIWRKMLTDIDLRNQIIGEYDPKIGGFPILPKYEEDLVKHVEEGMEDVEQDSISVDYSQKLGDAYLSKYQLNFDEWNKYFNHYTNSKLTHFLFDRPVTLAVLGLRDFRSDISPGQKEWCIQTISNTLLTVIFKDDDGSFGYNFKYNLLEKEIVLSSFHLLFESTDLKEEKNKLMFFLVYSLASALEDHEKKDLYKYFRTIFSAALPNEAKTIWKTLIELSKFKMENPIQRNVNPSVLKELNEREESFLRSIIDSKDFTTEISEIDLIKFEPTLLAVIYRIIPFITSDPIEIEYLHHFTALVIDDLHRDEYRGNNRRLLNSGIHIDLEYHHLPELLLHSHNQLANSMLDLILDATYKNLPIEGKDKKAFYDFSFQVTKQVIVKMDHIIGGDSDFDVKRDLTVKFWSLWSHFFTCVKESGIAYFAQNLLLSIEWKDEAVDWEVLKGKKDLYKEMVEILGPNSPYSVVNVLSSVGDKEFLPDGLSWMLSIYRKYPNVSYHLILHQEIAERFIQRLFYNHITEIKKNKQLMNDYLWLLNLMVDFGSSDAYLFRENVITYKMVN